MPKCAGCTGFTLYHDNSDCVTLTGAGTIGSQLIASLVFNSETENCLNCDDGVRLVIDNVSVDNQITCGPDGLYVPPSGGGGGTYPGVVTVSTPSFSASLGTPEPYLSAADFVGDGVSDDVAIQAAIDQVESIVGNALAVVLLFPGLYMLSNSIDQKGVTIFSWGDGGLQGGSAVLSAGVLGGTPQRIIDNSPSNINGPIYGLGFLSLFEIPVLWGGTGSNSPAYDWHISRCYISGEGSGTDVGILNSGEGSALHVTDCAFIVGSAVAGATAINATTGSCRIVNNLFREGGVRIGPSVAQCQVVANYFNDAFSAPSIDLAANSNLNHIADNYITSQRGYDAILLTSSSENSITNNKILYDLSNVGGVDGIRLTGTSSRNNVQMNKVQSYGGGTNGRYGINIDGVAGPQSDNFVTNNDLKQSGGTGSFNDAGAGTVTTAGNRL